MDRIPQMLSLVALAIVSLGTGFLPNDPLFLLASNEIVPQLARLMLAGLLILQLTTDPPRRIALRALTGVVAVTTILWSFGQFLAYSLEILDLMVFVGCSLVLYATALEHEDEVKHRSTPALKAIKEPLKVRVHRGSARKLAT